MSHLQQRSSGIPKGPSGISPPSAASTSTAAAGGQQQKSIIEIYTDWANHYLDKLPKGRRRKVSCLQTELADGLVLADVIEAVTGAKVAEINRKPRSPGHMADNIQRCLEFLRARGVQGLEDIQAKEIRDGQLKAILGLFFQLSRYKQQQKQALKAQGAAGLERTSTPKIPSVPPSPAKSAIPSPMKGKALDGGSGKASMMSKIGVRQNSSSSLKSSPGLLQSPSKRVLGTPSSIPAVPGANGTAKSTASSSMLAKFGLKKGSSAAQKPPPSAMPQPTLLPMPNGGPGQVQVRYQYREKGLGKRTSSSSGFSSARSVGSASASESSVSLSSDTNFPSPSALRRINENSTFSSPKKQPLGPAQSNGSPKQARASSIKKFASPRSSGVSSSSPKRSPKFSRANPSATEIKDYGMIDGNVKYPPHAGAKESKLPQQQQQQSRIPGFGGSPSRIAAAAVNRSPKRSSSGNPSIVPKSSEADARTGSLPRQNRPEDASPGQPPNVAVVSPMPSLKKGKSFESAAAVVPMKKTNDLERKDSTGCAEEESSALKNLVPMQPLFGAENASKDQGNETKSHYGYIGVKNTPITAVAENPYSLDNGYLSDGDAAFGQHNGHASSSHHDDGYMSEGGASFYARKIQTRLAIEKQKAHEEQRKKFSQTEAPTGLARRPLPGLPDILDPEGAPKQKEGPEQVEVQEMADQNGIYRVIGNRNKNVPKSEMGMQTDNPSAVKQQQQPQQQLDGKAFDWKQAMAHNAMVLSSQEKAMDEYLRRQRAAAEHHIQAANKMMISEASSVPATPAQARRATQSQQQQNYLQQRHHSSLEKGYSNQAMLLQGGLSSGSLERAKVKLAQHKHLQQQYQQDAYSDSEYGRLLGSPMSSRRANTANSNSPSPTPNGAKRDAVFGSRSLPKGASSLNYGLMLDRIQQKRQHRPQKTNDGSLSDSNYAAYSGPGQSPYSWLQPASTYAVSVQDPYSLNWTAGETDPSSCVSDVMGSNESLNSVSSAIQQARANSLTKARLLMHQRSLSPRGSLKRNGPPVPPSEMSLASTVSSRDNEYYGIPSVNPAGAFQRNAGASSYQSNGIARFKSQPTSPVKTHLVPIGEQQSYDQTEGSQQYSSLSCYKPGPSASSRASAEREMTPSSVQGSSLSIYESKTDLEIRMLRKELEEEHEKVASLTSQLTTNAHVVAAFEQSLGNMTARLHQLTMTAEKKDSELSDLRKIIDRLRQSGTDAGLISEKGGQELCRQMSTDSVVSVSSQSDTEGASQSGKSSKDKGIPKRSGWLRHSFSKAFSRGTGSGKGQKPSSSKGGSFSDAEDGSITNRIYANENDQKITDVIDQPVRSASAASGNVLDLQQAPPVKTCVSSSALPVTELASESSDPIVVNELRRQLQEKESLLTETRLEALSSAHQLESLRETVNRMRSELLCLKTDNERLQNAVHVQHKPSASDSVKGSLASVNTSASMSNAAHRSSASEVCSTVDLGDAESDGDPERRLSVTMSEASVLSGPSSLDLSGSTDPTNKEGGKLVTVSVAKNEDEVRLGVIAVSGRSQWELLDSLVHRLFKEYVMRVDPVSNLGLNADSISSYEVGEVTRRARDRERGRRPEFLPYGYLVGDTTNIKVNLKGGTGNVDALAFETLTPKSIIHRYTSLLVEHKRVILSGPAGTGKTFMAKRLAHFLLHRKSTSSVHSCASSCVSGSGSTASDTASDISSPLTPTASTSSIADSGNGSSTSHIAANNANAVVTFNIDGNNINELKQFLAKISEQVQNSNNSASDIHPSSAVPKVVILDNLHHAGRIEEVFNGYLTVGYDKAPYIIGTLNISGHNAASNTTNLQLQHNFRWVLCANHVEPGKGFLGRYLRQKLLAVEVQTRVHDGEMSAVVEWVSKMHAYLNKFLEAHSGAEHTLGPRPFLSCPMDIKAAKTWIINLWNYSLVPYLVEALKEGIQLYGRRVSWEDPVKYLLDSWPWSGDLPGSRSATEDQATATEALIQIRPKDVGYDGSTPMSEQIPSHSSVSSSEKTTPQGLAAEVAGGGEDPLYSMLLHLQGAAAANSAPAVDKEDADKSD